MLTPGMGAVSTTLMAGVELIRKGESVPVGSLTQMGTIRLGKRTENRVPEIKDFVPLADPFLLTRWAGAGDKDCTYLWTFCIDHCGSA